MLTPSAGDDIDFCVVAIFGCHLKDKGNKIAQHILPRKRAAALRCCAIGRFRNNIEVRVMASALQVGSVLIGVVLKGQGGA